ncbi:MAG: EAL domain-containing protein [Cyanobacteria bacterium SID2]|nr:EAL domain-containing protein [Cyanobacteria bacterium SID2]MBP0005216.1 EAL domain-containing protein [Cyanobacteria bacterium SBC]
MHDDWCTAKDSQLCVLTERELNAVFEQTSDGVFVVDVRSRQGVEMPSRASDLEFNLISLNRVSRQMLSIDRIEIGCALSKVFPDSIENLIQEHCYRCWRQGKPTHCEVSWEQGDRTVTLLVSLSPITDPQHRVRQIVGLCQDTSERRRVLQEARLLQTITLAIAESPDFPAALNVALRKICDATEWDYGEAWVLSRQSTTLERSSAEYSRSDADRSFRQQHEGLTFPSEAGWFGQVWSAETIGDPSTAPPDSSLDLLRPASAIAHGFSVGLAMPLLIKGEVLGVLVFFIRNALHANRQKVSLVSAITVQLGVVLHHKKYHNIFNNAVAGIYQTTPDGRYTTVNPMLASIFGYGDPETFLVEAKDLAVERYVNPEERAAFLKQVREGRGSVRFETQVYRRDRSIVWIRETARLVVNGDATQAAIEGCIEDITQHKQAERQLHYRDALLDGTSRALQTLIAHSNRANTIPQALAIVGETTRVVRIGVVEYGDLTVYPPLTYLCYEWHRSEEVQRSTHETPPPQNQTDATFPLTPEYYSLLSKGQWIYETLDRAPDTVRQALEASDITQFWLLPIVIEDKNWGYLSLEASATEWLGSQESELSILQAIAASLGSAIQHQRTTEIVHYRAFHDLLTGLPNRLLFDEHLQAALARAKRNGETIAVCFLDLDRFKTINDTLGHAIGDQLLQQVSRRLCRCLRQCDLVARWGGDEFLLMLPQIRELQDAGKIARRLLNTLESPFQIDGHTLHTSTSIGIALYPTDGQDPEQLVKHADIALYRAKDAGRNNYQLYTDTINTGRSEEDAPTSEHLATLENLQQALERNEFVLYYQPQVDLDGEIVSWQAHLHWQHPTRGMLRPSQFLSLAEDNGLLVEIGQWALQTICQQIQAWQTLKLSPARISATLSACELQQPGLAGFLEKLFVTTEIEASQLELAIPETVAMEQTEDIRESVAQLQKIGVSIALDRFGTGEASLSSLPIFPLQTLKIHSSCVRDLEEDPYNAAAIAAIVAFGSVLNLRVVADGVETQAQFDRLRALKCPHFQGNWFGQPLSAEDATQRLRKDW